MAIITLAQYKAYASITSTDATRDAALTEMIDLAHEITRRACSRNLTNGFDSAARTEVYDGNNSDGLQLREFPVASITSVSVIDDNGTSTALDSTLYRADLNTGVVKRLGARTGRFAGAGDGWNRNEAWFSDQWSTFPNWPSGHQNISVVYTGGYTTMPAGLRDVMYQRVDRMRWRAGTPGFKSEDIGDYSYTLASISDQDFEERMDALLLPYKPGVA